MNFPNYRSGMSNSLSDHFDETVDDHTYRFSHRSATPVSTRDALVNALADIVARNKTDPHVTQVLRNPLAQ